MDQVNNGITSKQGWSWGGAVFSPYFIVGAKRTQLLWWYLFAFVPFLNIIFWIVVFFYFGTNGHEVAAKGTQFANQSEYDGYVKGLDYAGKIFFWIILAIIVLVGLLWIAFVLPIVLGAVHSGGFGNGQFPAGSPMQSYYPQQ
jgi:hypothetical protein